MEKDYEEWITEVNLLVEEKLNVSIDDIEDFDYAGYFEDGLFPCDVLEEILDRFSEFL